MPRTQRVFSDLERADRERQRLAVLAERSVQAGEPLQARRHIRMHPPELLLAKRQALFGEWHCLRELALLLELFDLRSEALGLREGLSTSAPRATGKNHELDEDEN